MRMQLKKGAESVLKFGFTHITLYTHEKNRRSVSMVRPWSCTAAPFFSHDICVAKSKQLNPASVPQTFFFFL